MNLNVSIILPHNSSIAGQIYTLTCSVHVPPHLMGKASIILLWTKQDNISQLGSNKQLKFSPIKTSDSAQYTCSVVLDTDEVSIIGEDSTYLTVTSK